MDSFCLISFLFFFFVCFFGMCMPSCFSTLCLKDSLSSIVLPLLLCQRPSGCFSDFLLFSFACPFFPSSLCLSSLCSARNRAFCLNLQGNVPRSSILSHFSCLSLLSSLIMWYDGLLHFESI